MLRSVRLSGIDGLGQSDKVTEPGVQSGEKAIEASVVWLLACLPFPCRDNRYKGERFGQKNGKAGCSGNDS